MQQDYSRPFDTQCHYIDSPTAVDAEGLYSGVTAYSLGVSADTRPELPGYNSGVLCIVIAMSPARHLQCQALRTLFQDNVAEPAVGARASQCL